VGSTLASSSPASGKAPASVPASASWGSLASAEDGRGIIAESEAASKEGSGCSSMVETHIDAMQSKFFAQSDGDEQAVRQLVMPQANGVHGWVVGLLQAPLPSQTAIGVSTPPSHDGLPQSLSFPGNVQASGLLPSHAPMHGPEPSQ
jgi:hypothetical protein